jgi:hypothetical protein
MRATPFTRPTIIAANEFITDRVKTHAQLNRITLRLGLEQYIPTESSVTIERKCDVLGRMILDRGGIVIETVDGALTLAEAFVREAVNLAQNGSSDLLQQRLERGLARDGYVVFGGEWNDSPTLRMALPEEIDLPATDDEVRMLLKSFGFVTAAGHLDQAVQTHTRGEWAAANAQLRTFLEGLFNEIAHHIDPTKASAVQNGVNLRQMLADGSIGFLAVDRKEWSADGKNYIEGLFKMLHTDGSHPGLSNEDHCTFRLHLVLVTARTFLRRLQHGRP